MSTITSSSRLFGNTVGFGLSIGVTNVNLLDISFSYFFEQNIRLSIFIYCTIVQAKLVQIPTHQFYSAPYSTPFLISFLSLMLLFHSCYHLLHVFLCVDIFGTSPIRITFLQSHAHCCPNIFHQRHSSWIYLPIRNECVEIFFLLTLLPRLLVLYFLLLLLSIKFHNVFIR